MLHVSNWDSSSSLISKANGMPDKSQEQQATKADAAALRSTLSPFVIATRTTRTATASANANVPNAPAVVANDRPLRVTGLAGTIDVPFPKEVVFA